MDTATAVDLDRLLLERLTGFVRSLRANGFGCGTAGAVELVRSAQLDGLTEPRLMRWRMRALLCGNRREWQAFDELYEHWWLATRRRTRLRENPQAGASSQRPIDLRDWAGHSSRGEGDAPADPAAVTTDGHEGRNPRTLASMLEASGRREFGSLHDATEQRAIEQLAQRVARNLRRRRGARLRRERRHERFDLGATQRGALRSGGEPLHLAWRRAKPRPPRLSLVLDVSASMNPYSMRLLRFARGLCEAFPGLQVFAFHTRLVDLSACLHEPAGPRMAARLATLSEGWSGGTRIGPALTALAERHGGRVFRGRASLIVASDGLDTADPAILETALRRIRPRCRRLVWLNPLLGLPGYEPRAAAMRRALPFLDAFAPAHDLASLVALEPLLRRC